ncbi:unnamed protein product [Cuscuta campestris]|uniref:Uncharacterized protein n=1 Tax=Cuscuta campestris TaxID=132261 RepID=A0A484LA55_9ASTE|nr:unnamed protein product [Cuscuta campestris]
MDCFEMAMSFSSTLDHFRGLISGHKDRLSGQLQNGMEKLLEFFPQRDYRGGIVSYCQVESFSNVLVHKCFSRVQLYLAIVGTT